MCNITEYVCVCVHMLLCVCIDQMIMIKIKDSLLGLGWFENLEEKRGRGLCDIVDNVAK